MKDESELWKIPSLSGWVHDNLQYYLLACTFIQHFPSLWFIVILCLSLSSWTLLAAQYQLVASPSSRSALLSADLPFFSVSIVTNYVVPLSVLGLLLSIDRDLTVAWEWFLTGWTNPAPNARPVMSKRKAPVTIHTRFSRACSLFDVRLVLQDAAETVVTCNVEITSFIPLREKFLQLDWLRVVVFQLNLKYLRAKITNLLR